MARTFMQLLFHTGAHFTEEERLMTCLLKNKELFGSRGVAVPRPRKYRGLLLEIMDAMEVGDPSEQARDVLLEAIVDTASADRLILSHGDFFAPARMAFQRGLFYPEAPKRIGQMARIFQKDELLLFMALKNPATFLPAVFQRSRQDDPGNFLDGRDPRAIRWSDMLYRLLDAVPQVSITVWCSEDAPMIWPEILREMGGLEPHEDVAGGYDLLREIMTQDGLSRFEAFVEKHPKMTDRQRRRTMIAFLEKFALEEAIEEELDMPGWSHALIEQLTEIYDDDVLEIARIPGVTVISP